MTVGVLFISTGGICRAPMAASVCRTCVRRANIERFFEVAAAGTFDGHAGEQPSLLAREVTERRGYAFDATPVRPLQPHDLARYHHVMAMDRTILAALRWMAPAGYTDRPQLLMRHVERARVVDIVDPYGGSAGEYARALDLIEKGCAGLMMTIVQALQGVAGSQTMARKAGEDGS